MPQPDRTCTCSLMHCVWGGHCTTGCHLGRPCDLDMTAEDLLCDECREDGGHSRLAEGSNNV